MPINHRIGRGGDRHGPPTSLGPPAGITVDHPAARAATAALPRQVEGAHARPGTEVTAELRVTVDQGLSAAEAVRRREVHGENRLAEDPPRPRWKVALDQFRSALFLILFAAALLAGAVGDVRDAAVILVVLAVNGAIGFVQEQKATQSLESLKRMLAPISTVRRDGLTSAVAAADLVPGDIVLLEAGARVPADGRIIAAHDLEADESSLTGESHPVVKSPTAVAPEVPLAERASMLFANSVIARGRAEAVVTATGMDTEIGKVARLIRARGTPATPLQRQLDSVGRRLAAIGIVTVVGYSLVALSRGEALDVVLMRGVALAVAAVPEGLPAVLALVLAIGVRRMAQRGAIVRRLASVETLGAATVICSDKTGTLTRNDMVVRRDWVPGPAAAAGSTGDGAETRLFRAFVLCSDATTGDTGGTPDARDTGGTGAVGDPMEVALLRAAEAAGVSVSELRRALPRVGEAPFDGARKFMATVHDRPPGALLAVKGAPDVLLPRCTARADGARSVPIDEVARREVITVVEQMAARGLRVLAAAERHLPAPVPESTEIADLVDDLVLLGLAGIADPPRPEAREAVARCRDAGVDVKMITGDHEVTGAAIAADVGIRGRSVNGTDLDAMDDGELARAVPEVGVFARVTPEHKVRIVRALTDAGQVVAMTGDGVNDAAALRSAHVGVAMGRTGTDITKEAADVVLTDDNVATIVGAVEQGRGIYDNLVKFIRFQLTTNIAAILTFVVALLVGLPAPLTAVQVLWVNMIADGPPALALGTDRPAHRIMNRPPRPTTDLILSAHRLALMVAVAATMATGTLTVLAVARDRVGDPRAMTLAFTTFVLFQVVNAVSVRAERDSVFSRAVPPNRWVRRSLGAVLALQVLVVYAEPLQPVFGTVALAPLDWAVALVVALLGLATAEAGKALTRHRTRG